MLDTTNSALRHTTATFGECSALWISQGWPREALLPGRPDEKKVVGRWTGRQWVGMTGVGLLKEGLKASNPAVTWDDIQPWPTDKVCVRGSLFPALDIDAEHQIINHAIMEAVEAWLGKGPLQWRGRKGSHRLLTPFAAREPGSVKSWRIAFRVPGQPSPDGKDYLVELLGAGKQWVASGLHPDGSRYEWIQGTDPIDVPDAEFGMPVLHETPDVSSLWQLVKDVLERHGCEIIDAPDGPRGGTSLDRVNVCDLDPVVDLETLERALKATTPFGREHQRDHDDGVALVAAMRFMLGREGEAMPDFVRDWFTEGWGGSEVAERIWDSCDEVEPAPGRFMHHLDLHCTDRDAYRAVQGARNAREGIDLFAAPIDEDMLDKVDAPWVKEERAAFGTVKGEVFDPWRYEAGPEFPMKTLPPGFADYAQRMASNIGTDAGAVVMSMFAACSGAMDHRCRLHIAPETQWWVRPRLWPLLVGPPSAKKSPAMRVAVSRLQEINANIVRQHVRALERYKALPLAERRDTPKPVMGRRFIVEDITPEALEEMLARQGTGLLMYTEELSTFIGSFERYGDGKGNASAAQRGFYLKAIDGGTYNVDRVTRDARIIPVHSLSLLGAVQIDRLRELGNLSSDGLLQRFLPINMQEHIAPRKCEPSSFGYDVLIGTLSRMVPMDFTLSPGAEMVRDWIKDVVLDEDNASGGYGPLSGFIGKQANTWAALAMLLHVIEHTIEGDPLEDTVPAEVGQATAARAAVIMMAYVFPHGRIFFGNQSGSTDNLRIASYLLTCGLDRFTTSDLVRGNRSLFGGFTLDAMRKVLAPFVAMGWLMEEDTRQRTSAWKLNPEVRVKLSGRLEKEKSRKAKLREDMMGRFTKLMDGVGGGDE